MTKFSTLIFFLMITSLLTAQDWITPVIEGYGKIKHFEEVAEQPDATLDYKLVFDITGDREMEGVNLGLWKIARVINMLGAAKIPKDKIHIVAAIHGPATFTTLNAEKYQEKYQKFYEHFPEFSEDADLGFHIRDMRAVKKHTKKAFKEMTSQRIEELKGQMKNQNQEQEL